MDGQQYHAGETVEATLDFVLGDKVRSVIATFAHTEDPDTKFRLSGEPTKKIASNEAGYTYWQVVLSGKVTSGDKLGTYGCEIVEARYSGGRRIPFSGVPNELGFEIVEEELPPPQVTGDWEWGAGS